MSYPVAGDYHYHQQVYGPPPEESASGSWAGYIALILVIILIIGLIIFFVYFGTGTGTNTGIGPRWNIINGVTGATDSLVGASGNYYIAHTSGTALSLTVTPPPSPIGQEFIIDNTKTNATITILTANPNANHIPPGAVWTFVWTTTTNLTLVAVVAPI